MKLTTFGYTLIALLAGSMLAMSLCLLDLSRKFDGALETLDHAYFERVLPLRQIDANTNELILHLQSASSDAQSGNDITGEKRANHVSAIRKILGANAELWTKLAQTPEADASSIKQQYDQWLRASALPSLNAIEVGAEYGASLPISLETNVYFSFQSAIQRQIGTMRQRGQIRHRQLEQWQRTSFFTAVAATVLMISFAAWLTWHTLSKHSKNLKSTRDQLSHATDEIELRVAQRTASLRRRNDAHFATVRNLREKQAQVVQSEKLAALGYLVSGVAHELNTPIGNTLLTTSTLAGMVGELQEMLSGQVRRSSLVERLDVMAKCCILQEQSLHKLAGLVEKFKEVAIDQHVEKRVEFDLGNLLDNVQASRRTDLKTARCDLSVKLRTKLKMVSYPVALSRVLHSLIDNALLHAFEGMVGCRIDITVRETERHCVHITFQDNGLGMSAPAMQRVFDPFFTTKMGTGGGGLGMTIAYNIVTGLLGGRISIGQVQPSGIWVEVRIPQQAPETKHFDPVISSL